MTKGRRNPVFPSSLVGHSSLMDDPMPRPRTLLLVALLAYLLTGVAQVRPEERAVVRRFGKVVARPGPGLWVGLPWGIDRVDRVPVRSVRQLAVGYDPETAPDSPGPPPGQLL